MGQDTLGSWKRNPSDAEVQPAFRVGVRIDGKTDARHDTLARRLSADGRLLSSCKSSCYTEHEPGPENRGTAEASHRRNAQQRTDDQLRDGERRFGHDPGRGCTRGPGERRAEYD